MTMFDMDGDGDFGIDDAALLGGVIGFAEESIREEEAGLVDEKLEDIEVNPSKITDVDLRLFYNGNPELFNHVVNTVRKHAATAKMCKQMKNDIKEVQHEIDAMKETEAHMNKEDLP
ncbi:hypothetical protein LCGC14_1940700 [marine sediment metagenome]|uniref:Uncharacterized protein n=1 Tax=marine sediment metagenome TaxID=412755 RepID=A0A0F9G8Y4_9ZZZZ